MYLIIILLGFWNIYNYFTVSFKMPYFSVASENRVFLKALNVVVLKWSLILGISFVVFGVAGLFLSKRLNDESNINMDKIKYVVLVAGVFSSICLIL